MNKNSHVGPKDFFLHLGATVALFASTIALINLIFEVLNRAMPDVLASYYNTSSIVWPISILIVLLPTLYVLEMLISRDIMKIHEKKDIWIRKWRIYLTLFLTGATIAIDIITLISTYLNGEITSRFIWKVVVVFIISAVIFAYYILAKNSESKNIWLRILSITGVILVIAGIVSGFVIVGSPGTQRGIRFDEQRVSNLSNIQYSIARYWQEFSVVPPTLGTLPEYADSLPKDPQTGVAYRYIAGEEGNTFTLCATFFASSSDQLQNAAFGGSVPIALKGVSNFNDWSHGPGEKCFVHTVSPVDFPPVKK